MHVMQLLLVTGCGQGNGATGPGGKNPGEDLWQAENLLCRPGEVNLSSLYRLIVCDMMEFDHITCDWLCNSRPSLQM